MLWIALAAQLSAPQPLNVVDWYSYRDVPVEALELNKPYGAGFRLIVAPDGRVSGCVIELGSTSPLLDSWSCNLAKKRARFRGAVDAEGRPTYGVYRSYTEWIALDPHKAQGHPRMIVPTLNLTVNHLPAGVASPVIVRVMFAVDPAGRPSSCVPEPDPMHAPQPGLIPIACEQVLNKYKADPVKDEQGNPVASVQDAIVAFALGQAAGSSDK